MHEQDVNSMIYICVPYQLTLIKRELNCSVVSGRQ